MRNAKTKNATPRLRNAARVRVGESLTGAVTVGKTKRMTAAVKFPPRDE
jgi:hypothetical protein